MGPCRGCWNLSPCAYFSAPSPQHRILLDFLFLDTECTYDYLFVYDGDSPQGPLLASLSGSTRPPPIEASSGKVSGGNTGSLGNGRERRSRHLGRDQKGQQKPDRGYQRRHSGRWKKTECWGWWCIPVIYVVTRLRQKDC